MTNKNKPIDYSHEVELAQFTSLRWLYLLLGCICLGLGVIGIFLPLLPTTPFLLAATFFYARSSVRFYNWLQNNRAFGPYIRMWRQSRSIPLKAKIMAISLIVITMSMSIIYFVPLLPVKILLAAVGGGVIVYILKIKTARN